MQIVQSVRTGDKVRQKIVRHVGVAIDDDELGRLRDRAEFIKATLDAAVQPSLFPPEETARQIIEARRHKERPRPLPVDLKQLREERRITLGIHEVYGALYRQLGLDMISPVSHYRASSQALSHTVMARIANPGSKRARVHSLEEEFGVQIPIERIYRMMDRLTDSRVEQIRKLAMQQPRGVLRTPLDVLLFDCTTLDFESFVADELKQPGYSKDAKFKESQVIMALMVTPEGLPVGYEVLPGATFEGHSLPVALERLRELHDLGRVISVTDRGMMNAENIRAIEEAGLHYIVGAKLQTLSRAIKERVLASPRPVLREARAPELHPHPVPVRPQERMRPPDPLGRLVEGEAIRSRPLRQGGPRDPRRSSRVTGPRTGKEGNRRDRSTEKGN